MKHEKESEIQETKEFYKVADAIVFLKENTKKRNFSQSFDLIFNLKNIDLRKPENKFSKDISLPHGRGKDVKIGVISDRIKDAITKNDIDGFSKKETKKLVRQYDFFLCEVPLMPFVGKKLGRFLAPIGKMPSPIPPNIPNIAPVIESKKKATRIRLRDAPTIQVIAGSEGMDSNHVEENINFVIGEVEKNLPKGKNQIRNVYLKMTMGKAIKLDVR
jgi:large subunit ribosomal protein L1